MPILRNMQEQDLPQVNLILSKAFTHALKEQGKATERVPLCREEFLNMYLQANPASSFVLADGYKIVAYCFSRLWGKVAWIGPLSVLPAEQGKGHGKKIVNAALESLKQQGAKTIGLEMSAHSSRNLAFYTKMGFIPQNLIVDLIKEVDSQKRPEDKYKIIKYSECSIDEKRDFLKKAQRLSQSLHPGLDYANEIKLVFKHQFGDAILVEDSKKTIGFVFGHTSTYSQEEKRHFLKINVIQLKPGLPFQRLKFIADFIEEWAFIEGFPGIYVRANTKCDNAYKYFISRNYKIAQNDLRMTLEGYAELDKPNTVNFSKWE